MKPLNEIIQELEDKYNREELRFSLVERNLICVHYDVMMGFMDVAMQDYSYSSNNVLLLKLSISMISHLTYNLILQLSGYLDNLKNYKYAQKYYLLNERYVENDKYLNKFENNKRKIDAILQKIKDNRIYDYDTYEKDDAFDKEYQKRRFGSQKKPKLRLEKSVSYLNGADLIPCLENLLSHVKDELYEIKNGSTYESMDFYAKVYDLNFLYYAKKIWSTKREQFRSHIANDLLRENVTVDRLDHEYRTISKDFCTTDVGKIWENHSSDKGRMAYELKRISIDDNQWDYFFSNILKMEEIRSWIYELEHPTINEDEYPESEWDKIFKDAIDVAKIKPVIKSKLPKDPKAPDWFVLHKVLEEIEWLQDDTDTHFISWVEDVYGWPNKAKDFKRIQPGLKKSSTLDWGARTITSTSIALNYKNLADAIRNEFVTLNGRKIVQDKIRYLKKQDSYISHQKQL